MPSPTSPGANMNRPSITSGIAMVGGQGCPSAELFNLNSRDDATVFGELVSATHIREVTPLPIAVNGQQLRWLGLCTREVRLSGLNDNCSDVPCTEQAQCPYSMTIAALGEEATRRGVGHMSLAAWQAKHPKDPQANEG